VSDIDLAIILADGDYLKREGDQLVGAAAGAGAPGPAGPAGPTGPAGPAGDPTQTIEAVAATTYTVVAADANKIKRLAATATITLPSAGPAVGERVDFICVGGPATFTLDGGATWDVAPTPSAVARAIGSVVTAIKMGATSWALTGDLA
jgi:hypothetical protein